MLPGRQICPPCVCPHSIRLKSSVGSFLVNFGGMGKQDRKRVTWDSRSGLFNVIRQIEMGIVDTGKVNALSATFDYLTFIYQHSDAHLLKTGQHSDRVVIS